MKFKSSLFVFLFFGLVAFLASSNLVHKPVEATTESVKTVANDQPSISSLRQTSCPTSGFKNQKSNFMTRSIFMPEVLNFGASNPQLISDRVAYTMILRLLSSHGNDPVKIKRLRGYVQQNLGINDPRDVLAVFRLALDFEQRNRPLDRQVNTIKERYHALEHPPVTPADEERLERLKQDKDRVVDNLIADIPRRMSENGKNRLDQSIQERVKSKIRIQ